MSRFRMALIPILVGLGLGYGCSQAYRDPTLPSTSENTIEQTKEKGPVKLVIKLSPQSPRLSDLVDFEIEVIYAADIQIKPPAFGQSVGDFLVRDYSEKSNNNQPASSDDKEKPNTRRFFYRLEPVHAGLHLIRSIAIEFIDNRSDSENRGQSSTIESDPIEVEITSELGDKVPSLADLAPMLPPRPLSQSSSWKWLWFALPVALAAVALIWFRRRATIKTNEPTPLTPSEIAHQALAALLAENLPAHGRVQEFYVRLTGIVRFYIEGTTGVRAPEQTTEEFLRAMHSRNLFPPAQSVRLQEFLEAADMVKYAGQQPNPDQIELSIARAREFVQMQSPVSIPVSSNGGQ